jgi:hypothetical protein
MAFKKEVCDKISLVEPLTTDEWVLEADLKRYVYGYVCGFESGSDLSNSWQSEHQHYHVYDCVIVHTYIARIASYFLS